MYEFQSEPRLYSFPPECRETPFSNQALYLKFNAISEGAISKSLSDRIQTKWLWVPISLLSLKHLLRARSFRFRTKWFWVRISLLSFKPQIWHLIRARSSLTFRQTIDGGFSLRLVLDMIVTYSQMHHTDKCSQHSSIIWPVRLNGWVFAYELSGCGFKSSCSHLNIQ